jgi:hypothetical protein
LLLRDFLPDHGKQHRYMILVTDLREVEKFVIFHSPDDCCPAVDVKEIMCFRF